MRPEKDLEAFALLNDLARGKPRPQVQWMSLGERKGPEGKVDGIPPNKFSKSTYFQDTGKKDERIAETQTDESLRTLSQARLRSLLAAQQALANSPACKRLPDKGSKILKKISQIESALAFVVEVDSLVLGLEVGMSQLKLDEKSDGKRSLEVDSQFREAVAKKLQISQQAKVPYSQASRAVTIVPNGSFPGVPSKYRSGAPRFLPLAEAQQLHRETQQRTLALLQAEGPSALVASKGSSFHSAHWQQPEADFSGEAYRDIASDFDDDEECEFEHSDHEEEEQEEEEDDSQLVTLHAKGE